MENMYPKTPTCHTSVLTVKSPNQNCNLEKPPMFVVFNTCVIDLKNLFKKKGETFCSIVKLANFEKF